MHKQRILADLSLPAIAAPMFLASTPALVIACCAAGIIGSMPALNMRRSDQLEVALTEIEVALDHVRSAGGNPAPYAINLSVSRTASERFAQDLAACVRHKVPLIITSVGDPRVVVEHVHSYGGLVFHDVTNLRHARKAIAGGVDGVILVCAGAGGHTGDISPFTLIPQLRRFFDGIIVAAGAIASGEAILAAQALGADMVSIGTRFIATQESGVSSAYKSMLVTAQTSDVLYTPAISGLPASFLAPSIREYGLDPQNLPPLKATGQADLPDGVKPWRDIWSGGQGVGLIDDIPSASDMVGRLKAEYDAARHRMCSGLR
jgi:nitronate monooxygenase